MSGSQAGAGELIFSSDNVVGTRMRYKRSAPLQFTDESERERFGTCAALCSSWLKNMYTYIDPAATKPHQGDAALRFALNFIAIMEKGGDVDANVEAFNHKNLADAGLKVGKVSEYDTLTETFEAIAHYGGYYYIDTDQGHIVAAIKRGTVCFLYDPNQGLWRFEWPEFAAAAMAKLRPRWEDAHCWVYCVHLA